MHERDDFERALARAPVDRIVEDGRPGAGPLAGIEAGLDAAAGPYAAVVACDMPFVEPGVLHALFERACRAEAADAAVPRDRDGAFQPVQAVYRTRTMRSTVERLLPEDRSLQAALDALSVASVPTAALEERSFRDVDTRSALAAAERLERAPR